MCPGIPLFCLLRRKSIDTRKAEILTALKSNAIFSREDFTRRRIFRNLNESGKWELSFAQERLWFIEQDQGGSFAYTIPMAFELGPEADMDAFEKSIQRMVTRHEILRTVFRKDEKGNDYTEILYSPVHLSKERISEADVSGRLKTCIHAVFDLDSAVR